MTDAAVEIQDVDAGSPSCIADGGFTRGSASPAFGTFAGAGLSGTLCLGGAFAYIETTQGTISNPVKQLLLVIDTSLSGDPTTFQQISIPVSATGTELGFFAGMLSAAPGIYPSSATCGSLAFCVLLPTPSVDCGDAAAPTTCPPGCDLVGPVTGPTCMPITPESCWTAAASADCLGGTQSQLGDWSVALTSVTPYAGDASPATDFVVHGVVTANMIGDAGTATLTIGF